MIFVTVAAKINKMKVMKINTCNCENSFFDNKSIIVDCTLNFINKYKVKSIIENNCINYFFVNINIARFNNHYLHVLIIKHTRNSCFIY